MSSDDLVSIRSQSLQPGGFCKCYLVLIAGGHASGKRTVAHDLARAVIEGDVLDAQKLTRVYMNAPPRLSVKVVDLGDYQRTRFKPDVDFAKLRADLQEVGMNTVVFLHGLYALFDDEIVSQARLRIYLDSDADVRLSQWILRDTAHRDLDDILQEYLNHCRPEFSTYIEPTKAKADVLLPQGSEKLTIDLLAYDVRQSVHKKIGIPASSRATSMINLRAEAASNMEDRYYSTN